jgi:RNA-directed DNA polymerase
MTAQAGAILNTVSAWDAVDWRNIERNIGRLQARIVKAVQQVDPPQVAKVGLP